MQSKRKNRTQLNPSESIETFHHLKASPPKKADYREERVKMEQRVLFFLKHFNNSPRGEFTSEGKPPLRFHLKV
ncbi:unnamed protein product [Plasmodium vivax]|uniref:(malaria parasite P. vivax) hypothetical protein n=1 Tax=Plasmodium vivax TaxID=5855 RepID=A0A8S4HJB2_PLAVI|nr:unnamed protein product [Plasmodium vivax]